MKKTLQNSTYAALIIAGAALLSSCSHETPKTTEVTNKQPSVASAVSKKAAAESGAAHYTELKFKPGTHDLSAQSKKALEEVVSKAKASGDIKNVKVIAWADKDYPSASQKTLRKDEVRLAQNRAKAIRDYLKHVDSKLSVSEYNMAERPNAWQRLLNTSDAKVKNTLASAGLPTTANAMEHPSKASHSLVLVDVK